MPMSNQELADLRTPAVETMCLPVGYVAYKALEEAFQPDPSLPQITWPLSIGGHLVRGRWVVVGLRADYAIAGARTFWVTLEWRDDRG